MGKRICLFCVGVSALFSIATDRGTVTADEPKVLNNFVTERVRESRLTGPATAIEFSLPRAEWVFSLGRRFQRRGPDGGHARRKGPGGVDPRIGQAARTGGDASRKPFCQIPFTFSSNRDNA